MSLSSTLSSVRALSDWNRPTNGGRVPHRAIASLAVAVVAASSSLYLAPSASAIGPVAAFPITEYSAGLTPSAQLRDIKPGPDGAMWFVEFAGNKIGRIAADGAVTEYSDGLTPKSGLTAITAGPDGNMWFLELTANSVGRITPGGTITEFPLPTPNSTPSHITSGPDGNLWFTEGGANKIGQITTSGTITEFSNALTADSAPRGIVTGPDGNLWFTENTANAIGRITTSGVITEFSNRVGTAVCSYARNYLGCPTGTSRPAIITNGPDGNLWFTEQYGDRIGRITTDGTITEFSTGITAGAELRGIVAGPDGALWFTESSGNRIGRITTDGAVTEFMSGLTPGSFPFLIAQSPTGDLWFTENSVSQIGRIGFGIPAVTGTSFMYSPAGPSSANALVASVTPSTATGTIQFSVDGLNHGGPVPVVSGTASTAGVIVTSGNHTVSAAFTSSDPSKFTDSAAAPTTLNLLANPSALRLSATEYSSGITSGSSLNNVITGPDGALWFSELTGSRIGRMTTGGVVTEFSSGITSGSGTRGVAVGPDNNVWFTEYGASQIGRITTTGQVTEFSSGVTAGSGPYKIVTGPDGNLWFTEYNQDRIARITPDGTVTEFGGLTSGARPSWLTVGPDGNLWFTEWGTSSIGRITTSGSVTEFNAGISPASNPNAIEVGQDGNLWFTEYSGNRVGRITTSGSVVEYSAGITAGSVPRTITRGPDGAMWFTEYAANKIARIGYDGVVNEYSVNGLSANAGPAGITLGPDGRLWAATINNSRIIAIDITASPDAPTSLAATAGDASATLSWLAPTNDGGSPVTSYAVTSTPLGASCVVSGVTATCSGLTNGVAYTFSVVATNAVGDSIASAPSSAVTPVTVPSAPVGVTAVAGNGSATISWAAPTSDGGSPVTGYSVTLSPGSASCSTTVGVDPNPLTCIVSGLTDGITYAVSVVATNAQGSGPVAGSSASPTAVQFVTGYQFGCVLSEGAVHCWGSSSSGTAVPSDLGQVTKLTDTYGGGEICALLASHTVRCWGGENYPGMNAWVQSLTDVYDVEVLSRACVVRGADRHVECFGQNDHGQSSPPSLTNVTNLALNSWESCAISSEQVSCWGWNHIGQGSPPAFPATPMKLVMGADTSCAVLANSELWCWGQNEGGQISPSQPNGWPPGLARGRVASAVTPSQVAVGWYTICLVDPSGTVQCSGGNGADPGGRPSITNAAALTGWYTNYCALTTDMAVSCWGPSVSSVTLSSSELLGLIGPPNVSPQAVAPSAPVGVTALAGNASASVSWTAPADDGGAAITSYTVTSSPAGGTCAVTGVTANCTGLTNGTAYTFTVVATNSAGNSPSSAASATVAPATTPDAPTSVAATAGVRSANVSWTAPANNGGASITGYTVTSSPSGASCVVTGTAASCTGLANATSYTFTVVATNRVGNSASSAASAVITTPGLPSAPTGVTATAGDTTVAVSWTAPASDGGSPITAYVVASSPAAGSCVVTGTAAACSGLTNGTAYSFSVKARSAVGDSAASAASNSVTPLLRPNSPTALTVTPGNGLLTVKWTAATVRTGVAITGYTATATPGGFTCSTTAPRNGSAPTTCNIVGLVNGTSYVVSLVANSANGASSAVVAAAATPRTVPSAPGGVTGVAGNGQVTVSWLAPASNGGSPITGYTVTSSRTSGTCTTTGALTCVVTGLTNGTSYTFTVKATNAAGTSIASSASAGVVPIGAPTAPRTVTATANTKTHVVTVKWSTPTSTGGASIVVYTATLYNALTGGTVVTTCTTSAVGPTSPATTCVMPVVAAGTYYVDVTATNASGFVSPASTPRTRIVA